MAETKVLTTSEVAAEIGTDGKTLRKFFRSSACSIEPVGQGKRYGIDADDVEELKAQYAAWAGGKKAKAADDAEPAPDKAPAKAKKSRASSKKAKAAPVTEEAEDIDDELLSLDEVEGPADDELLDIDDLDEADLEV